MRHIVCDLAHRSHQFLDLREHGVQVFGQPIEFVAAAGQRHALRQVPSHDGPAGSVNSLDPPQRIAAHQQAADQAKAESDPSCPSQRPTQQSVQFLPIRDVAADKELKTAE